MQTVQLRHGGRDFTSRLTDVSKYGKTSVVSFFRPLRGDDHGIHIVKKDFLAVKGSSVPICSKCNDSVQNRAEDPAETCSKQKSMQFVSVPSQFILFGRKGIIHFDGLFWHFFD
jgi:hypothetical protein